MRLRLGLATLLLGTLTFALVSAPAEACGRRGRGASAPAYYSASSYSQPYYGTTYSQPMYGQSMYGQPMYSGPSGGYPPQKMPPVSTVTTNVALMDDRFDPGTVTVVPGTTVKWTNMGKNKHTVTADKGEWDSGDIPPGASYTATFTQPGTFTYNCRYQKDMKGTIVVAAPSK